MEFLHSNNHHPDSKRFGGPPHLKFLPITKVLRSSLFTILSFTGSKLRWTYHGYGDTNIEPKIKFFMWLSWHDRIPHRHLLAIRGAIQDPACPMCPDHTDHMELISPGIVWKVEKYVGARACSISLLGSLNPGSMRI